MLRSGIVGTTGGVSHITLLHLGMVALTRGGQVAPPRFRIAQDWDGRNVNGCSEWVTGQPRGSSDCEVDSANAGCSPFPGLGVRTPLRVGRVNREGPRLTEGGGEAGGDGGGAGEVERDDGGGDPVGDGGVGPGG